MSLLKEQYTKMKTHEEFFFLEETKYLLFFVPQQFMINQ